MSFRVEQKYLTTSNGLPLLYSWLEQNNSIILHRSRTINSIYLDNINFSSYRDSQEGLVPRKKVRIRCYGQCALNLCRQNLEVKISSIEGRFKTSEPVEDIENLFRIGYLDNQYGLLMPVVKVSYLREYYFVKGFRITIDTNIDYFSFGLNGNFALHQSEENFALEIKSSDQYAAEQIDINFPFQKTRFSKYCRAIESLNLASY